MKRICMTQTVTAASGNSFKKGREYTVSNKTAADYMAAGYAETAEPIDLVIRYLHEMNAGVFVSSLSEPGLAEAAQKAGILVADATEEELPLFQAKADEKTQKAVDVQKRQEQEAEDELKRQKQDEQESKAKSEERQTGNPIEGRPDKGNSAQDDQE